MKVYTIATRKGGAGKTTWTTFTATHLFHALFKNGNKICVIEFDKQKSLSNSRLKELKKKPILQKAANRFPDDFKERMTALYPIYTMTYEEYLEKYNELSKIFSICFLDFPGTLDTEQTEVLKTIDKAVIPIFVDDFDIESAMSYMKTCEGLGTTCGWFLNRRKNSNKTSYIIDNAHEKFFKKVNGSILKVLNTTNGELLTIPDRQTFYTDNRSTILPFDDEQKSVLSIVKFFMTNN